MDRSKPASYSWGRDGNLELHRATCFTSIYGPTHLTVMTNFIIFLFLNLLKIIKMFISYGFEKKQKMFPITCCLRPLV